MRSHPLRLSLDCAFGVCVFPSFFFFLHAFVRLRLLFMYCSMNSSRKLWLFYFFQPINAHRALFMDLQISFFNNFFIKNDTIYTFKNYFATVFFNFQLYSIGPKWYCTNQILVTMWNGINKVVSTTKNHLVQYES